LESGGPVQLVYEAFRGEAVGDIGGQTITPDWWHRWESFGLPGLFNDQELPAAHESIHGVHLQGAAESAEGWRKTLDAYRSVIGKSLDDIFSRRGNDEQFTVSPCGDLRESVFTTPKETLDDPEPGYAVALSG
jgi:hypothetical protein